MTHTGTPGQMMGAGVYALLFLLAHLVTLGVGQSDYASCANGDHLAQLAVCGALRPLRCLHPPRLL